MTTDETITLSKKELARLFLELEREQSHTFFHLFKCLDQLEDAYLDLRRFLEHECSSAAHHRLAQCLFSRPNEFDISDETLTAWDEAFETQYNQAKEKQAKNPPRIVID